VREVVILITTLKIEDVTFKWTVFAAYVRMYSRHFVMEGVYLSPSRTE
jgi:hypothetical protein